MIRTFIFVALALSLGAAPAWAAKTYYKWVDENGVTHYSSHKPHGRDSEQISITTGQSVPSHDTQAGGTAAAGGAEAKDSANTPVAGNSGKAAAAKDPERCKVARDNLQILQENARVRIKDEDGSFRFLDEAEKAAKLTEYRQAIEDSC